MRLFDEVLAVSELEFTFTLASFPAIPWDAFLLNPRRLRGSDFLMKWSQGRWSEDGLISAVRGTEKFIAVPYGPSSTAPDDDPRKFELYFEELEKANPAAQKRPDLVIVSAESFKAIEPMLLKIGGTPPNYPNLPFVSEAKLSFLLEKALLAVECENSLWICKQMPYFNVTPRPMKRLGGKPGLPKAAVLPTVIVKEEDRERLRAWQQAQKLPIHIWHVFFDLGFGVAFDDLEKFIVQKELLPQEQRYQAPSGQAQVKTIYKLPYYQAYELCQTVETASLRADSITDKNGHILPFVRFDGGKLRLLPPAMGMLESLEAKRVALLR